MEQKTATTEAVKKTPIWKRPLVRDLGIAIVILAVLGGTYYWFSHRNEIYTDDALVVAPLIDLSPETPGELKALYVTAGSKVTANQSVAQVGDGFLTTDIGGIIVDTTDTVGHLFNPGEAVVTMIDPNALRIVARVDENKGFVNIKTGDAVTFTVDAFGKQKFQGTVDSVSPTAVQSQVVFNISDKRETRQFEVKIKYDVNQYPQILNGMSAKVTIDTSTK